MTPTFVIDKQLLILCFYPLKDVAIPPQNFNSDVQVLNLVQVTLNFHRTIILWIGKELGAWSLTF